MTKKKTIDEIKNDFIKVHGNKYDYSKVEYVNSQTKVKIICQLDGHGEFEQQPNNHLMGKGCKKCSYVNASIRGLSNTSDFIKKATQIHSNIYCYKNVDYINNKTHVKIICNTHGEFEQTPAEHLSGCGCQICGKNKQIQTQTKSEEQFIIEANNKHNNKYDYSKVKYINTHTHVKIICNSHGEFEQVPSSHLSGAGCPKCATIQQHALLKSNTDEFVKKAKEKHGDIYNYQHVNYVNNSMKVKIRCNIHGEFEQTPAEHLSGCGCKQCGFTKISKSKTYSTDEYIQKVKEVHQNIYNYTLTEYNGIYNKINVLCKEHGIFEISASNHLRGRGCQKCQTKKQYSKAQIKWLNFIQIKDNICIQHAENSNEYQIPNTRFKVDGYCIETNTIYEFHGDYWHGNPNVFCNNEFNKTTKCTFGELYKSTISKEQQIIDMGFNLITIWESDWIKLNKCIRVLQRKYRSSKH
jgi:hypothetical protein